MFFPSGLIFFPHHPIPTRFPRAWYIESTEKVEKRDFRAVSNGYKPPQDFYDFMVFLWFRLWEWSLMRWYIADCNRNMPKACPYVMMKSQIWYDLLPRNHFIIMGFSPWTASGFYPWGKCEAFHFAPRLFFVFFVFDSIHDSATMHNLSPGMFHWAQTHSRKQLNFNATFWGLSDSMDMQSFAFGK